MLINITVNRQISSIEQIAFFTRDLLNADIKVIISL